VPACPCDPGAPGADTSKTKNIGKNRKISAPPGIYITRILNRDCTHTEKSGPITEKQTATGASGTIPLPGVPVSREFREVLEI
jgi:hypothetical protein